MVVEPQQTEQDLDDELDALYNQSQGALDIFDQPEVVEPQKTEQDLGNQLDALYHQTQGAPDILGQPKVIVEPQEPKQAVELNLEDRFKALVKSTEQSNQEQQEKLAPFVRKSEPKESQKPKLPTISEEKAMDFSKFKTVSGPLADVYLSTERASPKPKMPEYQATKSKGVRAGG